MKVLEIGFMLGDESFIEDRFQDSVNIIFSDDNNRGKTLVIQGLMYSIGDEPIFPAGFDYRRAIFYSKVDVDGTIWSFLRKDKILTVKGDEGIHIFETISEFKRFISENIMTLPKILKDGESRIVDPMLYYQIGFLPQDKRNTSNIIGSGYYNKNDFISMVYTMGGVIDNTNGNEGVEELKKDLEYLREEKSTLQKRMKFAKKHPSIANLSQSSVDRNNAENKRKEIQEINARISELNRERAREENRISKLERLITELNSLNHELTIGNVVCADCGSNKIIYKTGEISFEVSNSIVRQQVVASINEQITLKKEIVNEKTRLLNREQQLLNKALETMPKSIQEIILFKEEIATANEIDKQIIDVDEKIKLLNTKITQINNETEKSTENKSFISSEIVTLMNYYYKRVDPNGIQQFQDLFTKRDQTYSGSDEQVYYFSRMLAIHKSLKHNMPLVVDSFRDGEISSQKESEMIQCYIETGKQVILTSTLKKEEYSSNKYSEFTNVNSLDYSQHADSHILNKHSVERFRNILNEFGITAA